ncbi:family 10 glycosylhydrolase [Geitlerinema sp. PCC 9228]|jgi:hypothetical protein|uniref:family 10 glycosylhydrolase n=1 Tax=Geitlerinema sp. PCC 9228 TaxID=111611 RepID=UPI0008F9B9F5|nr:family 10 glycosylhydrolase [Geitlerinema sp. PCC 9228]
MAGIFLSGTSVLASTDAYCHFSQEAIAQKNRQRQAAFADSPATTPETAQQAYQRLIRQHAQQLQQCRQEHWLQNQAIWLRLYPCDLQPGSLEKVLDRIVNKGYNRVYLEVFYDGRVLLPPDDNPTPWPSVVPEEVELENTDLLEKAIAKGRERGLQVYAWMFTMNFGYSYAQLPDRQEVLARNGKNQTTLEVTGKTGIHAQIGTGNHSEVFIDPYHPLAQRDYAWLVDSVLQRQPDGVLLDYLRYKRGNGENSVVTNVSDLWIHGEASRQALSARADNKKGRELIRRFLDQGYITISDLKALENMYPDEKTPMWQGRWLPAEAKKADMSLSQRQDLLQRQLWYLSVAHAVQGVLDFFEEAIAPIQKRDIPTGAVFFPGGNRPVGEAGFDSRLQAWDRFPESVQWHPMLYAKCGETGCIVDELQRVLEFASNQTEIVPALAGTWGKVTNNRPALEAQMAAIHQAAPEIDSISHFAYSWQEPESDRERKFCNLSP